MRSCVDGNAEVLVEVVVRFFALYDNTKGNKFFI